MNVKRLSGLGILSASVLFIFFSSCFQTKVTPNDIDFSHIPYKTLSEYGFFTGAMKQLVPAEKVLLYEPHATLFTDYASKSRFVWMPEGASASIVNNQSSELNFPDKTILIKNFYYPDNAGKNNIVETRLLVKRDGKWDAFPYLWNEEQTEANYKLTGANIPMQVADNKGEVHDITYIQPNKNQCKSCHNQNEQLVPIGPKAHSLNFELDYGNGEVVNQLAKWSAIGYLDNYTESNDYGLMTDYNDVSASIDARAKAYLDANCAHCHNPSGPASTSGLFLTYNQENLDMLGVMKTPVAAGKGAGNFEYDILPGHGDSSIIVYRMNSVEPGIMMAELGRSMIHQEGVELIRQWIDEMAVQ